MNQIIIFHDGGHQEITEKQLDQINQISVTNEKRFRLNGKPVALSSIARILDIQDFYNQFPKKRPAQKLPEFKSLPKNSYKALSDPKYYTTRRKRALEGLIKGLKQYINSSRYKGTDKPKELLARMEFQLTKIS
jgi:hypothetical protein